MNEQPMSNLNIESNCPLQSKTVGKDPALVNGR